MLWDKNVPLQKQIMVTKSRGFIWTYQHPDMLTFHSQTDSERKNLTSASIDR